jgi:hypothetical protein
MSMSDSQSLSVSLFLVGVLAGITACGENETPSAAPGVPSEDSGTDVSVEGESDAGASVWEPDPNAVPHSFGLYELEAFEETSPCVIWTLDNEAPLYVNEVMLANDGAFHHSNWFAVPDTLYAGEDGYFSCGDRGFTELQAAIEGTVLFAQSTQSLMETQTFRPGASIKIPPNHSIVSSVHMLNLADRAVSTELRMQLGLIHPRDVEAILAPVRFSYSALDIPPQTEARFSADCELPNDVQDMKIHWVLPHYHYLGNHFRLAVLGGPNDGDTIYELNGFNADANGQAYDPPVDMTGAEGLRFTCGYFNPTTESVGWGIGDQEMCVMLALVESGKLVEGLVQATTSTEERDGVVFNEGQCFVAAFPQNRNQGLPTQEEINGELYLPSDDGTVSAPLEATCADTPETAEPAGPSTLQGLKDSIFTPSCSFSSCHGGPLSVAGLDLTRSDLHAALLAHESPRPGAPPLVVPGDPQRSYLYQLVAQCEPAVDGNPVPHMPLNAPELLPAEQVARIRDWIAAGAPDN